MLKTYAGKVLTNAACRCIQPSFSCGFICQHARTWYFMQMPLNMCAFFTVCVSVLYWCIQCEYRMCAHVFLCRIQLIPFPRRAVPTVSASWLLLW